MSTNARHGPHGHASSVRNSRRQELMLARRRQAWKLHTTDALTFDQIARRLGVSAYTAWHDVQEAWKLMQQELVIDLELHRAMVQAQLEELKRTHWKKKAHRDHARVILQIIEQERRLHGLDRERDVGFSAEQVAAVMQHMVQGITGIIPDPEQRVRLAQLIRRALPAPIDVTPTRDDSKE